jgi:hypothetical protein
MNGLISLVVTIGASLDIYIEINNTLLPQTKYSRLLICNMTSMPSIQDYICVGNLIILSLIEYNSINYGTEDKK